MGTMLNVFVRRVVRDRGVPFAMNAEESAKADGFATGDVLRWVGERGGAPAERISLSREQLAELLDAPKAAVA